MEASHMYSSTWLLWFHSASASTPKVGPSWLTDAEALHNTTLTFLSNADSHLASVFKEGNVIYMEMMFPDQ